MAAYDDVYDAGLQIFLALNAILEHQSDETIAAAINVVGQWEATYQNGLGGCWTLMQPYLQNYNPQYIAALQQWVVAANAIIYGAINPIILDGNTHGGHYNVVIINAQVPPIQGAMAEMNALRNPINLDQYQAPFTNHI
jgi:hypothetical protein